MGDVKVIVGLGNPGKKYERTRHNTGFLVADALIRLDRNDWTEAKGLFRQNASPFQDGMAIVAKPTVYMNESGRAVQAILEQARTSPDQILIVVDDVNLLVGKIRFRAQGSAGGHHGLESIVQVLGTDAFPRLRIGVGREGLAGKDLMDYVLGDFSKQEWGEITAQIDRAGDACLEWVAKGASSVMQRFN